MILHKERVIESVVLVVFAIAFLVTGSGNILDSQITHPFPYGFYASDAFMHLGYSQGLEESGAWQHYPAYMSVGHSDVDAFNPPVFYQLGVLTRFINDLPLHDGLYQILTIMVLFACLTFYLLIHRYNPKVAMLSLPLMLLVNFGNFRIFYLFGTWIFAAGSFFLIVAFFFISRMKDKQDVIMLGIILAAIAMTHTSEFIFSVLAIGFYLLIKLFTGGITVKEVIRYVVSGAIAVLLASNYLIIFSKTWAKTAPFRFQILRLEEYSGNIFPSLWTFPWGLLIICLIGLALTVMALRKKQNDAAVFGLFMFIIGFSNFIGFGHRAFQTRHFWPIYLAVFFGFALFQLMRTVPGARSIIITGAVSVAVIAAVAGLSYMPMRGPGLLDQFHWEAFSWIGHNLPQDAKVLYFYGDIYNQNAVLFTSKRVSYRVLDASIAKGIQEFRINRNYEVRTTGEDMSDYGYRTGLFSFGYHKEDDPEFYKNKERDICEFDYFVFDQATRNEVLAQYNLVVYATMVEEKSVERVFDNDVVIIAKNKMVGGDCITPKQFEVPAEA
ncbi:MAG: hypothetical protein ABIC95_00750 [archaeon]